jgi:hypothetical protein
MAIRHSRMFVAFREALFDPAPLQIFELTSQDISDYARLNIN